MPISINGSGSITGISAGGLPDASIVEADIATAAVTETKVASNAITPDKLSTGGPKWDSSGRLLIGATTARANFFNGSTSALTQVEGANASSTTSQFHSHVFGSSSASGPYLVLGKHRSDTIGDTTVVVSGDQAGGISFQGSDGTEFVETARIQAFIDGTPGANDMPGRLVFSTTADGASTVTEHFRINSAGELVSVSVYNNTSAVAANMAINSSGKFLRATSSVKYKTDIETLGDQYADAVLNCRPVWYRSTTGNDNPNWGWWGFIAEEVAEIDPRLVHWKTTETSHDENGSVVEIPLETPEPEGVQYDRFVPHLLNLIKRQQQEIANLKADVAQLKQGIQQ